MGPTLTKGCDNIGRVERSVRVVRVFTREGAGGNPLGIHDGLLDADEMQTMAATLGYSETIFIGAATEAVTPVRIFTPTYEMPFAGHPLVGATWHCAAPGRMVVLGCQIGTVTGRRFDSDRAGIEVEQTPSVEAVDPPVGVTSAWVARMPLEYEVHRLADPDAVAGYTADGRPDHRLVFAFGDDGLADVVRARFFAGGVGVDEDPATGSAAVALAAVLRSEGRHSGSLTIHQGAEMGCPSLLELAWSPALTTVSGSVVDDGSRTVST
jgi:trans-2,3-dihydro-3-hydroxyanthranilate isomerase